uniref:KH domain protein n=1 Tax=Toxoplasma gondii TgCATBr9 TaxID=943120 RepID=A0A2T6IR62_TOXGO|nr:hypothetical protein TGBR9_270010B [Toxoplasma gondii TgCATBr9]
MGGRTRHRFRRFRENRESGVLSFRPVAGAFERLWDSCVFAVFRRGFFSALCEVFSSFCCRYLRLLRFVLFASQQQLPNGLFSMDLAISTNLPAASSTESASDPATAAATAVRPESWQRLLKKETQQKIRERTGAAVLARGKPGGEGKKGLHLRITADKKATVLRGAICARDLLCAKQQLMFPPHVAVPANFDAVAAMQGPDAEFLRQVFDISHAFVDVQGRLSQGASPAQASNGGSSADEPLNFAIFACTEDSLDKAVALIKWRLACVEEALKQHADPDSFLRQKQAQAGEQQNDTSQTLQPRIAAPGSVTATENCMQVVEQFCLAERGSCHLRLLEWGSGVKHVKQENRSNVNYQFIRCRSS